MPRNPFIPLEASHQIMAAFGIAAPTPSYQRLVKPDGFDPAHLRAVLADSRFVFVIDWRAELPEELEFIAGAVRELGAAVEVEFDHGDSGDEAWVACASMRERVKYVPSDRDDFTDVIAAIQRVVPPEIE